MSLKIDSNVARVYYSSFIVIINIEMKLENKHTKHFELKNSELFFRFSWYLTEIKKLEAI